MGTITTNITTACFCWNQWSTSPKCETLTLVFLVPNSIHTSHPWVKCNDMKCLGCQSSNIRHSRSVQCTDRTVLPEALRRVRDVYERIRSQRGGSVTDGRNDRRAAT